jgi:hypothetical protein
LGKTDDETDALLCSELLFAHDEPGDMMTGDVWDVLLNPLRRLLVEPMRAGEGEGEGEGERVDRDKGW